MVAISIPAPPYFPTTQTLKSYQERNHIRKEISTEELGVYFKASRGHWVHVMADLVRAQVICYSHNSLLESSSGKWVIHIIL